MSRSGNVKFNGIYPFVILPVPLQ